MASAAHPYTVEMVGHGEEDREEHEEKQREEKQRERLPRRFDELPRDAQWLVLKHTGARFVVTRHTQEEPLQIGLPNSMFWPYFVPVIVRYEFRLLPRRASGPEMTARFTLSLDPAAIRQSPEWHRPGCYMTREFQPFSELRFDEPHHLGKLFCFLRRGQEHIEVASRWSRFDDDVLMQVREKMETVFRLPLLRL
jgi:hypothetical protein